MDEKAEAENQNASIQAAIPQELLGQWEMIDSYILDDDSAMHLEDFDLEILEDGSILIYVDYGYYNVTVLGFKILYGDRLLFYSTEGYGDVVSFEVDENQLRLSIGDEYYLYQRKVSN